MGKLLEVLKLTRIEHSLLLAIAVVAAELLSGGLPSTTILILSLITPVFISMGAFAINDYFDIEVDRKNKKSRPLVTGALVPSDALLTAAACMGIGIIASMPINAYCMTIAVFFAALSFFYSYRLKEILLVGNIYIALTMVIPFAFGSYVLSATPNTQIMIVSVMVFLSGLALEIHGTIRDFKGDIKERKVMSLPRVIGLKRAAEYALLFYLLAIFLSVYLFAELAPFKLNPVFGALIAMSDILLLYVSLAQMHTSKSSHKFYRRIRNLSLAGMGIALLAILAASLAYI